MVPTSYLGCSFAPNHKGMPGRRRSARFPVPPGAHFPQSARRLADRLRARRPELL